MRAGIGAAGAGLGMFLVTFGALLHFVLAPRLFAVPLRHLSIDTYQAAGASYFSLERGAAVTGVDLVATVTVTGDPAAGDDRRAVWEQSTELRDVTHDRAVDYTSRRTAMDRRTGLAVACCAGHVDGDASAPQEGLAFAWPTRLPPGSYPYYDPVLRRAAPVTFAGAEAVAGMTVHRYEQRVAASPVGPRLLPRRAVGLPGRGGVEAEVWYETVRVFWVEPVSGTPVDALQHIREVARTPDGIERATMLSADLRLSPRSRAERLDRARSLARRIELVDTEMPLAAAVLGLLLIGAGGLAAAVSAERGRGPGGADRDGGVPGGVDRDGGGPGGADRDGESPGGSPAAGAPPTAVPAALRHDAGTVSGGAGPGRDSR